MTDPKIIVALDVAGERDAENLASRLDPRQCRLKVGLELFTAAGPGVVEKLQKRGFEIFLDLKFHDIPHTVARAVERASALGVWMLNVHALGGSRMMEAAAEAAARSTRPPRLIAVTVLTSHSEGELAPLGLGEAAESLAARWAGLARAAGLQGVVCSPREAHALRLAQGPQFLLVTPGIRGPSDPVSDQRRTASAREALAAGASYLVVGRPITGADDPRAALDRLVASL